MGGMWKRLLVWFVPLCLAPALALAQTGTCDEQVSRAIDAAASACEALGRNEACYGNVNLTAEAQPGVADFRFEQVGDMVNVSTIQSLTLSPLNETSGDWGVAMMKLQANLPDTLPGQNVTFVLFGDMQITNAVSGDNTDGFTPMQAFYLRGGVDSFDCGSVPPSGLLVQTPEGVGEVTFRVNGADIRMGSTVFFQAEAGKTMAISTFEGAAYVTSNGGTQVVLPGTWIEMVLDEEAGLAREAPGLMKAYAKRFDGFKHLPLGLLERPIELAEPLPAEEVDELNARIRAGEPMCGQEPFPDCDKFPGVGDLRSCVMAPGPDDPPLPEDEKRPLCPPLGERLDERRDDRDCVMRPGPNDPPLPEDETRPFCEGGPGEQPGDPSEPPGEPPPPPPGEPPPPGG
ncbi:MAG: hypothetical protein JNM70_21365 [Anaerolineae bacterium]|nr:hypothetical protein [Anaerolineae bacterium]